MKPIEHQLRPKGLGLGADRSAIVDLEPGVPKRPPKPGDERKEEEMLVLGPGGCVQVLAGAHKELYGKVSGLYFINIHFYDSNGELLYWHTYELFKWSIQGIFWDRTSYVLVIWKSMRLYIYQQIHLKL